MQAKKPAVLIVEDERIIARDMQQLLAELGYDPFAIASNSEEALTRVSERLPDVVLMDIRLKGEIDGISTAELLRSRFDVPVIYLTAHADDTTVERAKNSEPYGYLIKPVDAARLRSAIEVCVYKHRIDRKLRERERWLEITLRSIADGVVAVDGAGLVTFMNSSAEELVGRSLESAQGRPAGDFLDLVDQRTRKARESPLDLALRERKTVILEAAMLRTKDKGDRLIADSAAPVVDDDRVLGAVMVFRDVTDEKGVERQLEAADRLASLGTMAAGVAHEVNNPLLVVTANATLAVETLRELRGFIQSASEPQLTDKLDSIEESVGDIHSAALRIGRVVADLRGFSRTSEGAEDVADIARCVKWAVRTTTHELRQRAQIVVHVPESLMVRADESRLGQVLINLLLNAAQSIEAGQASVNEIRVTAEGVGDEVVVEVKDTGSGIAEDVLPKIFDPFFTTKPFGIGTGLGLSICHAIVRSAGGRIEVSSEVGEGSLFRVVLQRAPKRIASDEPPRPSSSAPRRGCILVVDDEAIVLKAMRRILEGQHEIVCAETGQQGLELIRSGAQYDLLFCDLMMPDMNGVAFYEDLAKTHPDLAKRVVFLTGAAPTPELEKFLASVKARILQKPFDAKRLRQVVASFLMSARW
jgi:two-component system, cell cycle sensor histidine kinase and response regulator CckA